MKILDSRAGGRERSRAAEKALGIAGALLIPAAVIYLEILLRLTAKMEVIHSGLAGGLCTALAFALGGFRALRAAWEKAPPSGCAFFS